jgi:hypothetical protein
VSRPQRGGSIGDLFMTSTVPFTREDGVTIQRYALRCRWCFSSVTAREEVQPVDMTHNLPCRVADLIERYKRGGNSPDVVNEYDSILDALEAAERREPS